MYKKEEKGKRDEKKATNSIWKCLPLRHLHNEYNLSYVLGDFPSFIRVHFSLKSEVIEAITTKATRDESSLTRRNA